MKSVICGAALVCTLLAAMSASADEDKSGKGLVCVPIQFIRNSPAIDDKTILLELNGKKYKRIDLASDCPDLTFKGFSYATSINQLCASDPLHVNEAAGAVCMIKDIVDISPDEAKALKKMTH